VLSALRDVEDNLVAMRMLESQAATQAVAAKASRESVTITNNQYEAGIVTYLAVVIVQTAALGNERTELAIRGRRLLASVDLIKSLGGGWEMEAPKPAEKK
jgi:outer membrane protein TolC